MTRRNFIQSTTTAAAVAALTASGRGVRAQGGGAALRVRRSAMDLPADDAVFKKYAAAVKAMHERPANDPLHWRQQAIIHAEHCAHGTRNFVPWHRHYVNEFEKIC